MIDKLQARLSFSKAADSYDEAAALQREIGQRMLERLDYVKLKPEVIVDVGSGTGFCSGHLIKRYPKSQVIALDFALPMVMKSCTHRHWLKRPHGLCADLEQLPMVDRSVDLIVSNAAIQWSTDLASTFAEFKRVLKPNGLLMFTTFGPDTLKEIRQAWAEVDDRPHVSPFVDMHDVGDALLGARFADPVIDMEMITMTYSQLRPLMADIKAIGAHNASRERHKGLTGKKRMRAFTQAYEQFRSGGVLPSTWEVIYGHAWAADEMPQYQDDQGATRISVSAVRSSST